MLKNLLTKNFIAILSAALILLNIVVIVFMIIPARNKNIALKNEIENVKNTLATKSDNLAALNQSLAVLNAIPANDILKLQEILPGEKDIAGLLQIFEDKAIENNFILKTIDITSPPAGGRGGVLPARTGTLQITTNFVGGDYTAFKNLISSLEKNARLFDITSFRFEQGTTNYFINLKTYWLESADGSPISFDQAFFADPVFKMLNPARRELKIEPKGKDNPFQ